MGVMKIPPRTQEICVYHIGSTYILFIDSNMNIWFVPVMCVCFSSDTSQPELSVGREKRMQQVYSQDKD